MTEFTAFAKEPYQSIFHKICAAPMRRSAKTILGPGVGASALPGNAPGATSNNNNASNNKSKQQKSAALWVFVRSDHRV
jgi:hypothetical protein